MRTTAANDNDADASGSRPEDGRGLFRDRFARPPREPTERGEPHAARRGGGVVAHAPSVEETALGDRELLAGEELAGPFVVASSETEYGATVNVLGPPKEDRSALAARRGSRRGFEALLRRMAREWD